MYCYYVLHLGQFIFYVQRLEIRKQLTEIQKQLTEIQKEQTILAEKEKEIQLQHGMMTKLQNDEIKMQLECVASEIAWLRINCSSST